MSDTERHADDLTGGEDLIGPYKILDVLGEGGMGTVYLAEQKEPVRRRVALKVIKLGMDSKQVLARFELERQALAVMSHSAIAKVFDAGVTASGQPYFVMELVEGAPIAEYCDRSKLTIPERIAVFQDVCNGVQHAHQKGVLHRDLKPSNVLVTRKGNEHVVKIIDFGLARATNQQLVDNTIYTEQGVLIGTPEYMSPEQASGNALDIDTRTDIYSLGVLLYQLLTGELPFSGEELRQAGLFEIQRIIQEIEPAKPSTRISSRGDAASAWAEKRRLSTSALRRNLKGELDWIVMRAMAKEPARRYESATGLARDLSKYLSHEPVEAGPPSVAYRLRRMARKYRVQVAAGLFVFLVLIAGIITSWAFYLRAEDTATRETRQRRRADREAADARRARDSALRTQSLFLAEVAKKQLASGDAGTALCLALEALPQNMESPDRPFVLEAGLALYSAVFGFRERAVLRGHDGVVTYSCWSPDGTSLVSCSADGTARTWNTTSGTVQHVLAGHTRRVHRAAWSPDASLVATASLDGTARIWNAASGATAARLEGHEGPVIHVSWSPDGNRVLTASTDHTARIWDRSTGAQLAALRGHRYEVADAAWNPRGNRILTVGRSTVRLWNAEDGNELATWSGHTDDTRCLAWSPDGTRVATGSKDRTARIWNVETGKSIQVLRGHDARVGHLAWSPDGERIVTASWDNTARVWHVATGTVLFEFEHEDRVMHAAWNPDGTRIVTASFDQTARVWNAMTGGMSAKFHPHPGPVLHAAWNSSGKLVATSGADRTPRLWSASNRQPIAKLEERENVLGVTWRPDGELLATYCLEGNARIWNGVTGALVTELVGVRARNTFAAWRPDGKRILTADAGTEQDRHARIWNPETGELETVLSGHERGVRHAAWSPDGSRVLTSSSDKTARIWDAGTGAVRLVLSGHEGGLRRGEWSPDGNSVLTVGYKTVRLWNARDGSAIFTLAGPDQFSFQAAWSPDGSKVVTLHTRVARIWDASSGVELVSLTGHDGGLACARWSPDGSMVVTGSADKKARVWDASSGATIAELAGHEHRILDCAWSHDGRRIVTASEDKTARVWDAGTGQELAGFEHEDGVNRTAWSPQGNRIVTTSGKNSVRIFQIPTFPSAQALIDHARRIRTRVLSEAQRARFYLNAK